MNASWYKILLKIMHVSYGRGLKLKGVPVIVNTKGAELSLGENVTVKSAFLSNLVGLYQRTIIVTRAPGARIRIGDNVGISGVTIYARDCIEIGDRTCVGGNTKLLDNDFHPLEIEARNMDDKNQIKTAPIIIGKDCFIGCNALLLKGTQLGDGCVVGAGSVVTGCFEAGSVIAGNPARCIRKMQE